MINAGKRFENNFKASVPKDVFCYRLRDGTASWGDKDTTRFQCSNMCDYLLFDGEYLVLAELKNHKGKSLPLSCIRQTQLEDMTKADNFVSVRPMFIVNFEDMGECYAVGADFVKEFVESGGRKSIPIAEFRERGIQIPCKKKKVNTEYDLEVLF